MDILKKCKGVWGSSKRSLHPDQDTASSGSLLYGKLSEKRSKKKMEKPQVAPQGCFAVYVGAERQRFVIKIKLVNHPLFEKLLEAAENEYGYRNDGPLWLPCDVDLFCEALAEIMESPAGNHHMGSVGCTFSKGHSHRHSSSVFHSSSSPPSNMSCADYELLV